MTSKRVLDYVQSSSSVSSLYLCRQDTFSFISVELTILSLRHHLLSFLDIGSLIEDLIENSSTNCKSHNVKLSVTSSFFIPTDVSSNPVQIVNGKQDSHLRNRDKLLLSDEITV